MDKKNLEDLALFLLRVVAGLILFYYGAQKFVGLFGGMGFQATLEGFQKNMGIPAWATTMAIIAEFFGGLGLIFGALTRVAAFGAASTMAVATFVNIKGTSSLIPAAPGDNPLQHIAFPLSIFAISMAILLLGPGSWALDQKIFKKRR